MAGLRVMAFGTLVTMVCLGASSEGLAATACRATLSTPSGSVDIFPANNPWNQDISKLPVHKMSRTWINSIGANVGLHPDFGTVWAGAPNGIPYNTVPPTQHKVPIDFYYADQSNPGPYPIPAKPKIEGLASQAGDHHMLIIDAVHHLLYETWDTSHDSLGWHAGSGAIFNLSSNALRPLGWTSADAAGLPIFPGLVRYDEVFGKKVICHALRFTVPSTQRGYIAPARHFASDSTDPTLPPMGLRLRLRATFNVGPFPPEVQVILIALKRYGMLLADNGSPWFISGVPDPRWSDDNLHLIDGVYGSDLEAVYTGPIQSVD